MASTTPGGFTLKKELKKLALNRETVRDLSHDELAEVAGGWNAGGTLSRLGLCNGFSMGARVCSRDSC
jgi:hypothetical protein